MNERQRQAMSEQRGEVYVDPLFDYPGKGEWCHMWADNEDDLHAMAVRIGLRRSWLHEHRVANHYDLRPSKRALAIKYGAVEMQMSVWMKQKQHNS